MAQIWHTPSQTCIKVKLIISQELDSASLHDKISLKTQPVSYDGAHGKRPRPAHDTPRIAVNVNGADAELEHLILKACCSDGLVALLEGLFAAPVWATRRCRLDETLTARGDA